METVGEVMLIEGMFGDVSIGPGDDRCRPHPVVALLCTPWGSTMWDDKQRAALVALLRVRPNGVTWPEIVSEVDHRVCRQMNAIRVTRWSRGGCTGPVGKVLRCAVHVALPNEAGASVRCQSQSSGGSASSSPPSSATAYPSWLYRVTRR